MNTCNVYNSISQDHACIITNFESVLDALSAFGNVLNGNCVRTNNHMLKVCLHGQLPEKTSKNCTRPLKCEADSVEFNIKIRFSTGSWAL